MGTRNVVGEKPELWTAVAKEFELPAPVDHETYVALDWKACQAWMRMGDTIRNWFKVEVMQNGAISRAQAEYFQETDPSYKIRNMLPHRGLELAMLMRCVGILEVVFAEHEQTLEHEKYKLWDWDGTVHTPVFYNWWKAPEGWTKEKADVNEDEHEAWSQRRKLIAREFSFVWV